MSRALLFLCLFISCSSFGQHTAGPAAKPDSLLTARMKYRLIGPFRGGRSGAVAGSYKNQNTFYFGATGGGVWKTTDGGSNWRNISDKYFGGSIGAVAVAPSDEDVMYVGEGENTLRGNVSEGLNGMWRTADGGRTWKNIGLRDARHIVRIIIHPRNPNILWAAVMGHLFGPSDTRGVYKSIDGGNTWKRTLFVNNQTGASDLVMESGNPDVLYAGTWRALRTPYSMESGGAGSGLWKSTDGGETWTNLSANKGLPKGVWGIVCVAPAPSNPDRVYALIENQAGGLFVSTDAGLTWTLASSDNNIRQRAWYFNHVYVDPQNENTVYALNVGLMRSRDGGKTFQGIRSPHSDHHGLWIDPANASRMILADDGGAQVSFDASDHWSTYYNQPTAQIYRVSTDNAFPYHILGAQQDNSTIRIKSRSRGGNISSNDWEPTAGFESGYVVADPLNPDIVYGGNYGGYISRLDHKTGENRAVSPWPDNPIGAGADVLKYRFQWNFPIFFSPHDPKRLYTAGNVLFVTENEGQTWQQISPDLTTNDKSKQAPSGGPITKDNTSVEYYCTIFTAIESPLEKDLLWTGSDDGLIHVSRNAGKTWEAVTPKDAPRSIMWNSLEADPFKKGALYAVGTRYKSDDFTPYIYKTEDYGKSWRLITAGIPKAHFARVVRADKVRPGLLYAGTEYGMYISYDDGANWRRFQLNLPLVPITDLTIKDNDLVVATQGRSFYVLDDLTLLQQMNTSIPTRPLHVFGIRPAYRMAGGSFGQDFGQATDAGYNPPGGVVINYYVRDVTDSTKGSLSIYDHAHRLIKTYKTDTSDEQLTLTLSPGLNQSYWDMYYPAGDRIEGMIMWNGTPDATLAPPRNYFARIRIGKDSAEAPFTIKADPNYKVTQQEYDAQAAFLTQVRDKFNEVQKAIKDIRALRTQINTFIALQGKDVPGEVKTAADSINRQLTSIEEALYQTKAKSGQDVLNYPIRLNDKLAGLFNTASSGNFAPSAQARAVYEDLSRQADVQLAKLNLIRQKTIPAFNGLIRQKSLPVIGIN